MQTCSGKVPKWSVAGLAGTARRRFLCSGINVPHKNLSTSLSNRVSQFSPSQRLLAVWGTNNELSGCSPQQSCNCKAHAPGGCITSCRCQEERGSENRPAASQPWMQGFRSILFASALVTVLRLNQEAWADEIPAPSDSEAFISSTYDPVISIIFGFIVLCLVIVTGGVIYLSLLTYLDERREREEKAKFDQAEKDRKVAALSPKSPVPRAKKSDDTITTRGGGRGFGR